MTFIWIKIKTLGNQKVANKICFKTKIILNKIQKNFFQPALSGSMLIVVWMKRKCFKFHFKMIIYSILMITKKIYRKHHNKATLKLLLKTRDNLEKRAKIIIKQILSHHQFFTFILHSFAKTKFQKSCQII